MSEKNTGGPAFPTDNEHQSGPSTFHYEGMSLRDYFAAKALQGIIASGRTMLDSRNYNKWAKGSYQIADAMLEARG